MRGCLIKEYHFDCSVPTFLKEIHFTNFYTKSASAHLCYQDTASGRPVWVNLFKIQMMNDIHTSTGACAQVKITLPPTFETVKSRKRLFKLCIQLQQPSLMWKEYTITNVQFFDEYLENSRQATTDSTEGLHKHLINETQNALTTLYKLIEFKQTVQSHEVNETDISVLSDARFEIT
ncbi:unnamed protein product [Schistosoma rodhaini]|uniref:Uncharacterized protein n=1 Tax=Schistosoma rodhaini TaxID=6188 RepID=A0AA85F2F1_9TREM|nr:unnamed protein product [Schistosoma rodhaini]CAH8466105.1 unnamed protein product [Schistosoma rodhaini]